VQNRSSPTGSIRTVLALLLLAVLAAFFFLPNLLSASKEPAPPPGTKLDTAVFGMGCFWCSQALFEKFKGVVHIDCGYAGGHTVNPTYEDVCGDQTGHAEVVKITYDPAQISYSQLLDIFWDVHDPTTPDQQGDDVGSQYRSIILYETPEQQKLAEASKKVEQAKLGKPVTTEIVPLKAFYRAEEYHQDYFKKNPHAAYCALVISPKLLKLELHPPDTVKPTR
jgi:peptide-methionine (S)-S-oxide reductase